MALTDVRDAPSSFPKGITLMMTPRRPDPLPLILVMLTVTTGLVDAVSVLGLGRVFTANMTGNIVFLGFAVVGTPELSIARSLIALAAFLAGALIGGRIMSRTTPESQLRTANSAFAIETALLLAATVTAVNHSGIQSQHGSMLYSLIALTALAMGVRNATVRKLAVPDLTTTVLTLTLTGLAADSSLARGSNPRWQRRIGSVVAMFAGAALGALSLRYSLVLALSLCVAISFVCTLVLFLSSRKDLHAQA